MPVSLEPDPVIEAYKAGVDVTLLDENLRLTVAERVEKLREFVEALDELRAGAEGGFDPVERKLALAAGFRPIRLGPRILRTESAALAALAALQARWGDFQ